MTVSGSANVSANLIVHEDETEETELNSNLYLPEGNTITIADEGLSETYNEETGYINPKINVSTQNIPQNITEPCQRKTASISAPIWKNTL